jgi:hypothetical protein
LKILRDDENHDFDDPSETVVDPEGAITAPHAVLQLPGYDVGRADGCKACCLSCQEEVFAALIHVAHEHGLEVSEIANLVAAVRGRISPV